MTTPSFWRSWGQPFPIVGYCIAGFFIVAITITLVAYLQGYDAVLDWQKLQEQKSVESTIHSFSVGPFVLDVPAENFVIYEYFNGGNQQVNAFATYPFLVLVLLSSVVLITLFTTFERFWFIVGVVLFLLFVYSLRLKVLEIFGQLNVVPGLTWMILVSGAAIWFNMFKPHTPFPIRLMVFGFLMLALGISIVFFSHVDYPLLHLSVTLYPAAVVVSVLFILLVAHEVPAFFIYVLGRASSGKENIGHFLLFSLIYLVNLTLTAMHEVDVLEWDLVYVNPYLLLLISGVLGFWGFRNRESTYENIMVFQPFGALFFLAIGTIAFATIGNFLGNMNDAALTVFRHIIIFSHLGFSFIFVLYVLANYGGMISQNLPAYKVLYKPTRMPYFTFQFAGLIVTLAFIFYVGWRSYIYHGIGGFYTALGDLDVKLENPELARAHYEQAAGYSFGSHHANYALARLSINAYSLEESHRRLDLANEKRPSAFSQIHAGNLYLWQKQYFDAINRFRAAEAIRGSGYLENNLGYAFAKIYNVDSAVYYLNQARQHAKAKPSAETNFFALAATEYLPVRADSVLRSFATDYVSTVANSLALANVQKQPFEYDIDPLAVDDLNLYSATLLNNYLVRNVTAIDSTTLQEIYTIADQNEEYSEALKVPIATAYYFQHNVRRALEIMAELAFISSNYQGNYNYLMGLWALEQGNAALAASYFDHALRQEYKDAALYKAIALAEDGQREDALIAWDSVAAGDDPAKQEIALRMKHILQLNANDVNTVSDAEKYQFLRYRIGVGDTTLFNRIIPTFENNNYKASALLDMSRRQFEFGDLGKAIRYFNELKGLALTDENLYREIQHLELLMLSERKELLNLARQINEGVEFPKERTLEKMLYTALLNEGNGDTTAAEESFSILAVYNPYFEEGVIAAANYFREKDPESLRPYNILAEAVQINDQSVKLWTAYISEAFRKDFEEYATSALARLQALKEKKLR